MHAISCLSSFVSSWMFVYIPVLRDPDSNPYSLLEGEGELGGDTDASESMGGTDRRRRSRRRRNDQEPSIMDAAANESDSQAATSENGLGMRRFQFILMHTGWCKNNICDPGAQKQS